MPANLRDDPGASRRLPRRRFLLGAAAAAAAPSGHPAALAQAPLRPLPPGVRALHDLEYGRAGEIPLLLDLYLPMTADAPLPLVIWVHGGAWRAGTKANCPAVPFTTRGYAVASVEYRLSQVATFPAQIHDCKAAVRWLRANAKKHGLDSRRFGAWGSSAGGHLVALLGTSGGVKGLEGESGPRDHSSRVQAVCDWFGPTDFLAEVGQPSNIDRRRPDCPEALLIGGPLAENPDKVARANPITYVEKNDPPFLIMHGDRDMTVPLNQSDLLQKALKSAGVDVTYDVIQGAGHGFRGPEHVERVLTFFNRHLRAG